MTDINKDEPNDIKDEPNVEPDKDNKEDIKDEPKDIDKDEQPKADKVDGSVLGQIRKVEGMIKNKEEVPKELMWVMQHIDVEAIKPEEQVDDFDKRYAERRDKERYEEALELLVDELDESEVSNISQKVDELRSKHPTMTNMEAYELTMQPVQVSDKYRRKARLKSQRPIPTGDQPAPDPLEKKFKQYCEDMRSVGITPTREKFDRLYKK